ncbi:MAG: efflux RND transporter periplasmic adaptor subunit [Phycisphaerae bacterium]|nr:efflux RND transporter periplasmic adaptor subunit [Phycisphaerae bacterium]
MVHDADLTRLARRADPPPTNAADASAVPLPHRRILTRIGVPAALLILAATLLAYAARDALLPAQPVRVVPVITKTGAAVGGAVTVQAAGWVEADPYPVAVPALADGVVREVLALEGESVQPGQVVARLIDDDARLALQRAEAELAEREAEVATAQAAADAAQRAWDHPIELVRKIATAEAMLNERRAELQRWPSELAAAEARSVELHADHERIEKLFERKIASEIEHVRSQQQCAAQEAVVQAICARRDVLEAQIAAMQAELDAAREHLRLRIPEQRALEESKAELMRARAAADRARAARDEAMLRLERMEVRAPVAGVVMNRLVEPGSKLMMSSDRPESTYVVRLYDPRRLQVRVDVPLADAASIAIGQPAEIVVPVAPDRTLHGRVTRIVNEADIQKNTLQVKVAIDDPPREVKPEMLARVRLLAVASTQPGETSRVFAPESLLQRDTNNACQAWVVDAAGSRVECRRIQPGAARLEGWIEIVDGLRPGDRVVADPLPELAHGQRVRIVGEAAPPGRP